MSPQTAQEKWTLASVALQDAYTDFILSRQAILGHASPDMVRHYAQMVDDDLLPAHEAYSPMDNIKRLR